MTHEKKAEPGVVHNLRRRAGAGQSHDHVVFAAMRLIPETVIRMIFIEYSGGVREGGWLAEGIEFRDVMKIGQCRE